MSNNIQIKVVGGRLVIVSTRPGAKGGTQQIVVGRGQIKVEYTQRAK